MGKPKQLMATALRDGAVQDEGWRVRKDGSRLWASAVLTTLYNEDGVVQGFSKVTHDETARHHAEENLRRSEERFRLAIAALKEHAFYFLSPTGILESWNAGAERIKGYTSDEIIGQHFSVFFTNDDRVSGKPMRELDIASRIGTFEEEGWRVRKDGSRFWASVVVTAIRDGEQRLRGFTKVTRDETAKHQTSIELSEALDRARSAEAKIRQHAQELEKRVAERTALLSRQAEDLVRINADLEQFAYVTSHDLKEPLRMITNYLDLIQTRHGDGLDEKAKAYFAYIISSAQRMQQMIEAVLEYSRTDFPDSEIAVVPSRRIVQTAIANLHDSILEAGATVILDDLPVIRVNEVQYVRIFQNLIANAVKFRSDRPCQIRIGAEPSGTEWIFSVTDNGIGIDPTFHDKLFKIFSRLHAPDEFAGTGIGLATCKRIIEQYGGRIWIESVVGTGSTFRFTHPREA